MRTYADWPGDGQGLGSFAHMLISQLIRSFSPSDFAAQGIDESEPDSKGCVLDDPAAFFFLVCPPPATHQLSVSEYRKNKTKKP